MLAPSPYTLLVENEYKSSGIYTIMWNSFSCVYTYNYVVRKPRIGYNPWIAMLKAWIRALHDNPWIVRSIRGSRNERIKYGSSQTMDLRSL